MASAVRAFVPNAITLLNLLCGCVAVVLLLGQTYLPWGEVQLLVPVLFIFLGAVFDFFDGFAARLLGVSSELGKQLDSLSDLVTFGLAPAVLYIRLFDWAIGAGGGWLGISLRFFPLLLVAFSSYRLGKFNIDTRQTSHFLGLATPASALFTCGLVLGFMDPREGVVLDGFLWERPWLLAVVVLAQCVLIVSEVPMFSLKVKRLTPHTLLPHILLLVLSAPSVLFLGWLGLALSVVWYVLLSVFFRSRICVRADARDGRM